MKNISRLRQALFPREFRIPDEHLSTDTVQQLELIAQLLTDQASERVQNSSDSSGDRQAFLAEVGTGLWRLRQKMTQPGTGIPLEEMRRAYRHLESVWDTLGREGVKIFDHTGEDFAAGRSLRVLAYQPTAGMQRERVIETVKPTIYDNEKFVQLGEVIVGTPETECQTNREESQ